jgi:hypothetical protein
VTGGVFSVVALGENRRSRAIPADGGDTAGGDRRRPQGKQPAETGGTTAMATRTITGRFNTRREAEMAVEHLVQEYDLDRSRVHVRPAGEENTSGEVASGADAAERHRGSGAPGDPPGDKILPEGERAEAGGVGKGAILVSAEVDEARADRAEAAFKEYGAVVSDPSPGR